MRTLISLVLLLAFIGLSGCSENTESPVAPKDKPSLSKVVKTNFTVKEYPVARIDPGIVKVENGIMVGRKVVAAERWETNNPLITGNGINTCNMEYNISTGKGSMAGTYVITPDNNVGGGKWESAYKAEVVQTGASEWTINVHATGRGTGGTIDGMQYEADVELKTWDIMFSYYTGTGQGIIIQHTF